MSSTAIEQHAEHSSGLVVQHSAIALHPRVSSHWDHCSLHGPPGPLAPTSELDLFEETRTRFVLEPEFGEFIGDLQGDGIPLKGGGPERGTYIIGRGDSSKFEALAKRIIVP